MAKKVELYETFKKMFPDLGEASIGCDKIGSKAISVKMKNGQSLVFLYDSMDNWSLGTKYWRSRPTIKS